MTNFANHKEQQAKVNIGSLDQTGEVSIKTGNAYKLIFTPNETLQNTSGLCLLYTSPSPRDRTRSRMPSSA